ncbi:MAG: SMC-Scp complex subunit ScpB [Bacteroidetes bacterium]|nr:MAG: SMC-Scp complex subunit ScpB [Bacteroidota bacterium]
MNSKLSQIIEAIIFVADQPVKAEFLQEVLAEGPHTQIEMDFEGEGREYPMLSAADIDLAAIEACLQALIEKYQDPAYAFELRKVAGGYQFYSKKEFFPYLRRASLLNSRRRLSRVAMETLAIIAYRQPITKAEIEFIRGVNCDYAVQKLLDKQLISIVGRADAPGRPLLYATSAFFMQYFGINSVEDLPKLKEFEVLAEEHLEAFRMRQEEPGTESETEQSDNGQEQASEEGEATLLEGNTNQQTQPEEEEGESLKTENPNGKHGREEASSAETPRPE